MLWTLIQREILANLMTFRFPVAVIACAVLGLTIAAALTDNYEQRYADEFNDFLIVADRADPDSLHVPFIREGMSDKPVSFESIPKFQDSVRLGDAFKGAMLDGTLLLLCFVVLFAAAHVSFQRKEI